MSKMFEAISQAILNAITETLKENNQADSAKARMEISIRSLTGLTCPQSELYNAALEYVDDEFTGSALAGMLDSYENICKSLNPLTEAEGRFIDKLETFLDMNKHGIDDTTINLNELFAAPAIQVEIPDKAKSSAAAEQKSLPKLELATDKEEGGVPVSTGVFHKSAEKLEAGCDGSVPKPGVERIDVKKQKYISLVPEGYTEVDLSILGLRGKYAFRHHATATDRSSRLFNRNTGYAIRPENRGGQYTFFVEDKVIRERDVFLIARGEYPQTGVLDVSSKKGDIVRYLEEGNHPGTTEAGNGSGVQGSESNSDDVKTLEAGTSSAAETGESKTKTEETIRSTYITWIDNIPGDKYVLYSNGQVYDAWNNKYVVLQASDYNGALFVKLTDGRPKKGHKRQKTTTYGKSIRISKLLASAQF